ncbi:hypothetical protein D6C87_07996 [Aureobasidium pullulans]|uniref:Uncharacterized protein n=1 Tax=Aureobasidium pullulans TaxID=5580 RepID=A0A4S9UHY9_AURPU|nr:hypothetical protein D6D21_09972 [Aureobasidium pullulans]THX77463.1 hypothetical protein D6D04_06308 [Aureobasidium pullulans]THY68003.1 hypothetical protein D6C94_10433 [Aureobasidium pullulans]THZ38159.1 hypothetical protein D6C87_07996 [Aureobasidium pullulans]TIA74736.1 hypothetical protein D6C76_06232 [Aureobasidium pullulans]
MSPIMFEQLHSGELQLRDIGTFILEGRCSNSIQARRRPHDTPNLSENAKKTRKRFADLWQKSFASAMFGFPVAGLTTVVCAQILALAISWSEFC